MASAASASDALLVQMRIESAMMEVLPSAIPLEVQAFALANAGSSYSELARELDAFVQKMSALPEIPQLPPKGWKVRCIAPGCIVLLVDCRYFLIRAQFVTFS